MADNKLLTSMRFHEETLEKLKYIAWFERVTFTDTVVSMANDHIAKWEKKNGDITPELAAKAVKK